MTSNKDTEKNKANISFREKLDIAIREYTNYIIIVGLLIINVLISLMRVEEGQLILNDFSKFTWIDWLLWIILIIIPSAISVLVRVSFQREGIFRGKDQYKDLIKEYQELIIKENEVRVRSEKEFLTENAKTQTVKTLIISLTISFFSANLMFGFDRTGIIRLAINTITSLVIGYIAFSTAYNYSVEELKIWYMWEIERLKGLEYEAMVKSKKYLGDGNGIT